MYFLCFYSSQVDVFTIDEATGGLELSHTLLLSSKDFPGDPGPVKCIRLVYFSIYQKLYFYTLKLFYLCNYLCVIIGHRVCVSRFLFYILINFNK